MFADVIISADEMRRIEAANFAAEHTDDKTLMLAAGQGCTVEFCKFFHTLSQRKRIVVFAGHGNNGGDGVVIANELTHCQSVPVILVLAAAPERFSDCSKYYFERLSPAVQLLDAQTLSIEPQDVIIDALLGTGCRAPVRAPYGELIDRINSANVPVFAVDLPSGLGTDKCVKADFTAVIGYFKDALFTADGVENSGILRRVPLPLTLLPEKNSAIPCAADLLFYRQSTPPLPGNTHKYRRGSVLVIGGSAEYMNAPFLTARSALRSGAGLVRLVLPFPVSPGSGTLSVIPSTVSSCNGSFCHKSWTDLQPFLPKTSAVAAGPGMGRSSHASDFTAQLLTLDRPLLLDADALFHLGNHLELLRQRQFPTVLTPHGGEARLLAEAWDLELPPDNIEAARRLAHTAKAVILLKGPRTVTAAPDGRVIINTSATAALATAGSGDCLSGAIAAELCHALDQGDALTAAARGAFLHGMAGLLAEQRFGGGVIADDLPEYMAAAARQINRNGDIFPHCPQ